MSLTNAEANAVNALLRYVFDLPSDPAEPEGMRADLARDAAMVLAGKARKQLGAGVKPVHIALACSERGWPSHDGGALLALVDPAELPCACPDTHRLSGETVPYCPRDSWVDMAPWIAEAGYVLARPEQTQQPDGRVMTKGSEGVGSDVGAMKEATTVTAEHVDPEPLPVTHLVTLQFAWGGLCDGRPADDRIHLVRGTKRGTPGPTLCQIDRFADDAPGFSVGGGITGPNLHPVPCPDCRRTAATDFPGVPIDDTTFRLEWSRGPETDQHPTDSERHRPMTTATTEQHAPEITAWRCFDCGHVDTTTTGNCSACGSDTADVETVQCATDQEPWPCSYAQQHLAEQAVRNWAKGDDGFAVAAAIVLDTHIAEYLLPQFLEWDNHVVAARPDFAAAAQAQENGKLHLSGSGEFLLNFARNIAHGQGEVHLTRLWSLDPTNRRVVVTALAEHLNVTPHLIPKEGSSR